MRYADFTRPCRKYRSSLPAGWLALFLVMGALFFVPVHGETSGHWQTAVIDPFGAETGGATSTLNGPDGYPRIGYYDSANGDLKYAWEDAAGWHISLVDAGADVGEYASLALGADGYPCISYYDEINGNLKFARQTASGWQIAVVDSAGNTGWYGSLEIGPDDYPRISYYDYTATALNYAWKDGSGWHRTEVDSGGSGVAGKYTSLELDGNGYPHISYYDETNADLKYAWQDAAGWHTSVVDSAGAVGWFTSLELGNDGYPRISYQDYSNYLNFHLKYAWQNATGWHTAIVDQEEKAGSFSSLAMSADGYPRIAYSDDRFKDLKYAWQDGAGWHITTLERGGPGSGYVSLATGPGGFPEISYYNGNEGAMKYARVVPDPVNPAPTVIGITPGTAMSGTSAKITDLAGTGFLTGCTVNLNRTGQESIFATGINVESATRINCTIPLPAGTESGQWNVVVTNPDGQQGMLVNGFTVVAPDPGNPAPTVTGITPGAGTSGSSAKITDLAGTGFLTGCTVNLNRTGQESIFATGINVESATRINCTIPLPAGTESGQWNVVVTNPDGQQGMLVNGFTVLSPDPVNPAPTVTGITPGTGTSGTSVTITDLAGTGFLTGCTVNLNRTGQESIFATGINVESATRINCTIPLPAGTESGQWNVVVTNPDSQQGMLENGFTVITPDPRNPAPIIIGIIPGAGTSGTSVTITDLAGTGFLTGCTVNLNRTGQESIFATGINVESATRINCTIPLPAGTESGQWNVVVTNPDSQQGMLENGFTVVSPDPGNPAPTVTRITPDTGTSGTFVTITDLAGTEFLTGCTVNLNRTGQESIFATDVHVESVTRINCTIPITAGEEAGVWNVVVTNPDGQQGMLVNGFTVVAPDPGNPAPTVTGITPGAGTSGSSAKITDLAGTGFLTGCTVNLNRTGQESIFATDVNVESGTRINCTIPLPAGTESGQWNVVITNPDSQQGMLVNGFTVLSSDPGNPAPTVTGITPGTGTSGTSAKITDLAGTGFLTGCTVNLNRTGQESILATGVHIESATSINCTIPLPAGTESGQWNVVVTNPDSQQGMLVNGFTVITPDPGNPAPTVTGITPDTGTSGTSVTINNLAGTGFLTGLTVNLTRTGQETITSTDVRVESGTNLTCTFLLPDEAQPGLWTVVVTNPDGQQGMRENGFTIAAPLPSPTVMAVRPARGLKGTIMDIKNISGTNFRFGEPGTVVELRSPVYRTIVASKVRVISPTRISCTVNLRKEPVGRRDVYVGNPDGQSFTLAGGFRVTRVASMTTRYFTAPGS